MKKMNEFFSFFAKNFGHLILLNLILRYRNYYEFAWNFFKSFIFIVLIVKHQMALEFVY
jgi:hypothetical protein